MNKRMVMVGLLLIALGVMSLLFAGVLSLIGLKLLGFALRFWPLLIVALGAAFVVPPLRVRGERGLGGLFIPGMPILVTGGILLLASVLNVWGIWAWLWPMEVLAVATGFLAAALYMGVVELIIPATIVGANGLLFQFCAVTGLWEWWSVLWTVEPLSIGLALLIVGIIRHSPALTRIGLAWCAVAAACFLLMTTILIGGGLIRLFPPVLLILVGLAVVGWGLLRRQPSARAALE
ncbi:MAG: hypothetical protein JXM73_10940 [Anaerolineae bacterium]|nr:hypothetical protein [Anaerolineae bacterium]